MIDKEMVLGSSLITRLTRFTILRFQSGVSLWLAEQGYAVSVIGRRPERLKAILMKAGPKADSINPIVVDYRELEKLQRCVRESISEHGPIELAVFWIHSDGSDVSHVIASAISRCAKNPWRLFHVRGSGAHLYPESPPVPSNFLYRQVVLGFVVDADGSRWLSHDDISSGVVSAIEQDTERFVVGTLEPWERDRCRLNFIPSRRIRNPHSTLLKFILIFPHVTCISKTTPFKLSPYFTEQYGD